MSRYYINVRKVKAPFDPETISFQSRVIEDGGKILDIQKLDNFYKANKAIDKYDALQFAVSKQFGYKLDGSGNIIKIYDASKNGNDLDISRGSIPEDIEHEMFFLDNAFLRDESVTMDIIGDEFTMITDIISPDPESSGTNYIFGLGGWYFQAGGTALSNQLIYLTVDHGSVRRYRGANNSFNNANDANIFRRLDYRHSKGVNQIIRKDGVDVGRHSNDIGEYAFDKQVEKIVYGNSTTEPLPDYDADCYLNNSFFYNDYLSDGELEIINEI